MDSRNEMDQARQEAPAGQAESSAKPEQQEQREQQEQPEEAKGPTEWNEGRHGVGPWEGPWPQGPEAEKYDPELLREGDRRNVVDAYRYWRREAIRGGHR